MHTLVETVKLRLVHMLEKLFLSFGLHIESFLVMQKEIAFHFSLKFLTQKKIFLFRFTQMMSMPQSMRTVLWESLNVGTFWMQKRIAILLLVRMLLQKRSLKSLLNKESGANCLITYQLRLETSLGLIPVRSTLLERVR